MAYLIQSDYKKLIQADNLAQILGNDYTMLPQIESAAVSEVTSYLVQKYDVAKEFKTIEVEMIGQPDKYYGDRVYVDALPYDPNKVYVDTTNCLYNGNVYYCKTTTTLGAFDPNKWVNVGKQYQIYNLALPVGYTYFDYYYNYKPNDLVFYNNKQYTVKQNTIGVFPTDSVEAFGVGVNYVMQDSIYLGGGNLNTAWVAGDNRNQQMVNYLIDVVLYHLHSRISPRNIPELRVKRYDDAIAWLKQCAKGEYITGGLALLQPKQGNRIRYGASVTKQYNNY